MSSFINFKINNISYSVDGRKLYPESRLVDFIRDEANLKGTKFMCREGGCGACVVSAQIKDPLTGKKITKAVNSCLVPVLSCEGWNISTVEKLGSKENDIEDLHPIQQQMLKKGATQCGFCTPGMVMNMYSLLQQNGGNLSAREIEDNLDGNICRCTGYRPILDAFKSFSTEGGACLPQITSLKDTQKTNGCCGGMKNGGCCMSPNENDKNKEEEGGLISPNSVISSTFSTGEKWIRASSLNEVFVGMREGGSYRLIAGNTSTGIFKNEGPFRVFIDINKVPELNLVKIEPSKGIFIGGGVTISNAIKTMKESAQVDGFHYGMALSKHMRRVANVPVRNIGTLAGNLMIKHAHKEFPSDIFILLESVGATLKIRGSNGGIVSMSPSELLNHNMNGKIIETIHFPPLAKSFIFKSFKISRRFQNAHAYVNAGFLFNVDETNRVVEKPNIVFGGIDEYFVHATKTEQFLTGKNLSDNSTLESALQILSHEIEPEISPPDGSPQYRKQLTTSLLYKVFLSILGNRVDNKLQSGSTNIKRNLTKGSQNVDTNETDWPVSQPITKVEALLQCTGEAEFVNDTPEIKGELYAVFVLSTVANAEIVAIDPSEAMKLPGVKKFICARDVPGENNYYTPVLDPNVVVEEIFASKKVEFVGQPVGLILGTSKEMATKGSKLVRVIYANVEAPLLVTPQNFSQMMHEVPKRDEKLNAPNILKGEFSIGAQYHFHMETQQCIVVPKEDSLDVYSSTQWADFVQAAISKAINIPHNEVNMQVRRLGGSYGAKASRSALVASACAIGAVLMKKPVRLILDLETNMEAIGKRSPYHGKYEVGVDNNAKILFLNSIISDDNGYSKNTDDSPGHAKQYLQNCYSATNWNVETQVVYSNTAPSTWCRAPGSSQGIALIEYIMEHIAHELKIDPMAVREANFIKNGDALFPYTDGVKGTLGGDNYVEKIYKEVKESSSFEERKNLVHQFNNTNRWKKRGIACVPMRYKLNYYGLHYPVYIAIYKHDATVAICHGGAECGQGINTKVIQAVSHKLGIPMSKIIVKPFNNLVCPNTGVTGGSWTSELVCYAAIRACDILLERMAPIKEKLAANSSWEQIVLSAGQAGVNLTASHLNTRNDPIEDYNIWAVNVTEVEIDVLTGEYKISRVDLLEDVGQCLNPDIDIGQVEGALVMGLGLWTTEKIVHDEKTGKLLTNNTWQYKVPEVRDIPEDMRITFLKNVPNPVGVLRSKATGEPPLCTSVCVLFAIRNAIQAAREEKGIKDWFQINGPVSPEDILTLCLTQPDDLKI